MLYLNILISLFHFANCGQIISSELLKACLKLKGISPSAVYVAKNNGSEIYQNLNYQWNSRHGTITPLAYFLPVCRQDVQKAIRCGRKLGIRMVAKSGGHSFEKYSFGDSHTVVIDLQKLSQVKVNPSTLIASVGAGILNGQLYWKLWTNGKFGFPGPSCITTGVAEVTLGGGLGPWSKQFGLMSDNVVSMNFISPKGKFMVLSEARNVDLFWAMRGAGGGNFGIVTQFKFKIFPAARILSNRIMVESLEPKKFKKAFGLFQSFATELLDDFTYNWLTARGSDSLNVSAWNTNLTLQNVKSKLVEFGMKPEDAKVQSLNFIDTVVASATPYVSTPSKLGAIKRVDLEKVYYRAKSYFVQKLLTQSEIAALEPLFLQIPKNIAILIEGFGGAINRVSDTATSYMHRNSVLVIQVGITAENKIVHEWVQKFDKIILGLQNSKESYQNYIDQDLSSDGEYLHRYYGKNLARLVKIKNVIDPDDYFKFPMSIPLELPE